MRPIILTFLIALALPLHADDFSTHWPIDQLGAGPYQGVLFGGLYGNGTNTMSAGHLALGMENAARIQPLDENGQPSPSGKIVFLAVGYGDTARIMCGADAQSGCESGSLMAMARSNPAINHDSLVLLNAARDGADFRSWSYESGGRPIYDSVRTSVLLPAGVTGKQVQAAWVQVVTNNPYVPLGTPLGDGFVLKGGIAATLREMKKAYPNLQVAYLSSRVYGGYATTNWNPEPFAYESGFSHRWVIEGQIFEEQTPIGGWFWDTRLGNVDDRVGIAPWIAWGPYLWANGTTARQSDGLRWLREDFAIDGETLSSKGAHKGALLLLDFLLHEPTARRWLTTTDSPTRRRSSRR
ncbi:MAG: hypothetical protein ABIP63_01025 [Thermoanaerobaculia bacterium]